MAIVYLSGTKEVKKGLMINEEEMLVVWKSRHLPEIRLDPREGCGGGGEGGGEGGWNKLKVHRWNIGRRRAKMSAITFPYNFAARMLPFVPHPTSGVISFAVAKFHANTPAILTIATPRRI